MSLRQARRADALNRIADHMLAHGLAASSLRALAHAAGTSDRMLLYYFADKDELVVAALGAISLRLAEVLEAAAPSGKLAPETALGVFAAIMRGPAIQPHMRVWLELVSLSARGVEPYRAVAGRIADYFVAWVAERLDIADAAARETAAVRLVATLDGLVLLDLLGRGGMADVVLASHPH